MQIRCQQKDLKLIILVGLIINIAAFCIAFPQTFTPGPTLARDFSAYYIGEWRLFHNPTQIYQGGSVPGDYIIPPAPQTFKYSPSFLILLAPFLTLSYQNAFTAFDLMQIALMLLFAFFVYKLLKDKNSVLATVAAAIIIIASAPMFYIGYLMGNAHVLQTILLVGACYFGFAKKPWASALLFAFGSFDPRAALFALPLLVWYNRQSIRSFVAGAVGFVALTTLPFFFYSKIGFSFLQTEVSGSIIKQMYPYDWLPLYAIATLMVVEIISTGINNHKVQQTLLKKPQS